MYRTVQLWGKTTCEQKPIFLFAINGLYGQVRLYRFTHCMTNNQCHTYEPPHDKTNKMTVCPACLPKTQIGLSICPVWSESSLCAQWIAKDPSFLHADSEDWSDWRDARADLSLRWVHMSVCWFLAHLSRRLTRWAYSIPMVRRPSVVVIVHTFKLEYLWSHLASLDQILYVASLGLGERLHKVLGRLDQNSGFHGNRKLPLAYNGENDVAPFLGCFWSDPLYTCR